MGSKKVKTLLNIATALGLFTNCALAADNLTCAGPFGTISDTPIFTAPSGHLDPGQAGMMCPQILTNAKVLAVDCFAQVMAPSRPPAGFRCPIAASCPGVGIFQKIERIKGPMGFDQICVTYLNQGENTETFGIHITLAR